MWSLLAACTFSPGAPFVELRGGSLTARFTPAARDLGGGIVVNDLGFEWSLDTFEADLAAVEIQELRGAAGVEFDPANPPPGYTLCHGGHCHAEDGSLVDYSEIQAELAGGSAALVPVVGWGRDDTLDLLAGVDLALGPPDDPALPEVTLTRVVMRLAAVRLAGRLYDGDQPVPFNLVLPASELGADLGLVVDRSAPEALELLLDWPVDGTLFDGIDVPAVAELDPIEDVLVEPVRDNLLLNPLNAQLLEVR